MAQADTRDYDAQSFEWSMRSNDLVVLDFHVKHCRLCNTKSPLLERVIAKDVRHGRVQAFLADFDNDTTLKEKYHVKYRDTILFIHRNHVVARIAGELRHEALEQTLHEGLDTAFKGMEKK